MKPASQAPPQIASEWLREFSRHVYSRAAGSLAEDKKKKKRIKQTDQPGTQIPSGGTVKLPEPSALQKKKKINELYAYSCRYDHLNTEHRGSGGKPASRPLPLEEFQHLR